jgi:hypothetical protein
MQIPIAISGIIKPHHEKQGLYKKLDQNITAKAD